MWYPNKVQWRVIWPAFILASFLFIGGISHDDSAAVAAALCVLALGGLLIWRFSRKG
jgi:hypothetical protein